MISVERATFGITYYFKISLKREIQTVVIFNLTFKKDQRGLKLGKTGLMDGECLT